jgi:hypothetical protein
MEVIHRRSETEEQDTGQDCGRAFRHGMGREERRISGHHGIDQPQASYVAGRTSGTHKSQLFHLIIERFSPYQLIVGTLTLLYAMRNLDVLVGLGCEYSNTYEIDRYQGTDLGQQHRSPWLGW